MDLPQHYFPVPVCPHVDKGSHRRIMFAEYGSYQNVNVSIDEEKQSVAFWPQKGQGKMENLARSGSSLPLFESPVCDEWFEWDQILDMRNYKKVLHDLKYVVSCLPCLRGQIRNRPKSCYAQSFKCCKEITQQFKENSAGNQDTSQLLAELKNSTEGGLHTLVEKYCRITSPSNPSCLGGYNRDFYGGLLSAVESQDNTAEMLVHAGGAAFKDIYMTKISQDDISGLKSPNILSRFTLDDPVYQICACSTKEDKVVICARQKNRCSFVTTRDSSTNKLELKDHFEVIDDIMSSCSFSPYLSHEVLASTIHGSVHLWDLNTSNSRKLLEKPPRFECPDKWSCSYFGGHPRQIVVADNTSVEIFDHRSHFADGIELFSLSRSLLKPEERVTMATSIGFPYHAVVTDYAAFILDQRFGTSPVLQWSLEFIASPQYIQVLQQKSSQTEQEKMLFLASQQPAEVMCFPINIVVGQSPSSPILPWKLSPLGEFSQSSHTSYFCDRDKTERRFQASLAGFAISDSSATSTFTVYQMDAYGDIFYQTLSVTSSQGKEVIQVRAQTDVERNAADIRAEKWLKAFDTLIMGRSLRASQSESKCSSVSLDSSLLEDIFSCLAEERPQKEVSGASASPSLRRTSLHRRLRCLEKLPKRGSNTLLHLALRDNEDIKEILTKREADHTAMKKKMRETILRKQGRHYQKGRKKIKSIRFIESDTDSSGSDSDHRSQGKQNKPKGDSSAKSNSSSSGSDSDHGDGDGGRQTSHKETRSASKTPTSASVYRSSPLSRSEPYESEGSLCLSRIALYNKDIEDSAELSVQGTYDSMHGHKDKSDEKSITGVEQLFPHILHPDDDVPSTSSASLSDHTDRQHSSYTRSTATRDSSVNDDFTTMPFSINQNMLRRSFRNRDSQQKQMDSGKIHAEIQAGTDLCKDELVQGNVFSCSAPASKACNALSPRHNDSSQEAAILSGQDVIEHQVLEQGAHLLEGDYSPSSGSSYSPSLSSASDTEIDSSSKRDKIHVRPKKRGQKYKLSHVVRSKLPPAKRRKINSHGNNNSSHELLKAQQSRARKKVTDLKQQIVRKPTSGQTVKKQLSDEFIGPCLLQDSSLGQLSESHHSPDSDENIVRSCSPYSFHVQALDPNRPPVNTDSSQGTRRSPSLFTPSDLPEEDVLVPPPLLPLEISTSNNADASQPVQVVSHTDMSISTSSSSLSLSKVSAGDKTDTILPKHLVTQECDHQSNASSPSPAVAVPYLVHSPSLFSNASISEVIKTQEKPDSVSQSSDALAASPVNPHHGVLSWLLKSLHQSSSHKTCSPSGSPSVKKSDSNLTHSDSEAQHSPVHRKLAFGHSSGAKSAPVGGAAIHSPRDGDYVRSSSSEYDSNSDYEAEECEISSLHSSLSLSDISMLKHSSKMRRLVDPSLAGFLASPGTKKSTNSKFMKRKKR